MTFATALWYGYWPRLQCSTADYSSKSTTPHVLTRVGALTWSLQLSEVIARLDGVDVLEDLIAVEVDQPTGRTANRPGRASPPPITREDLTRRGRDGTSHCPTFGDQRSFLPTIIERAGSARYLVLSRLECFPAAASASTHPRQHEAHKPDRQARSASPLPAPSNRGQARMRDTERLSRSPGCSRIAHETSRHR
jgi:hypothetical protein